MCNPAVAALLVGARGICKVRTTIASAVGFYQNRDSSLDRAARTYGQLALQPCIVHRTWPRFLTALRQSSVA